MNIQYPKYALNEVLSASTSASTGSGSYATLITLGSITTLGPFPVMLALFSGGLYITGASGTLQGDFAFFRGGTQLNSYPLQSYVLGGANNGIYVPAALVYRDTPSAGSYTYYLKARIGSGSNIGVTEVIMSAKEESFL